VLVFEAKTRSWPMAGLRPASDRISRDFWLQYAMAGEGMASDPNGDPWRWVPFWPQLPYFGYY
jgi:hypothetical protein